MLCTISRLRRLLSPPSPFYQSRQCIVPLTSTSPVILFNVPPRYLCPEFYFRQHLCVAQHLHSWLWNFSTASEFSFVSSFIRILQELNLLNDEANCENEYICPSLENVRRVDVFARLVSLYDLKRGHHQKEYIHCFRSICRNFIKWLFYSEYIELLLGHCRTFHWEEMWWMPGRRDTLQTKWEHDIWPSDDLNWIRYMDLGRLLSQFISGETVF